MIKKTVTYKDFNEVEHTEDYYFHLTKGELIDWATEEGGGFVDKLTDISKTEDPLEIIPIVKAILIRAYGVRTEDGKNFFKRPEDVDAFQYSAAFSELYVELSTDADKLVEFVEGIMPELDPETQKKIDQEKAKLEKELKADKGSK